MMIGVTGAKWLKREGSLHVYSAGESWNAWLPPFNVSAVMLCEGREYVCL